MAIKNKLTSLIIPIIIALFNIFLVMHPVEMVAAATDGVQLWFNNVLPALLPFVVGANLLAGLGFIHFLGAIMSPVMTPLFKVPGAGAFALLTGLTSGYPMGAKAVAQLRETGQISRLEAQRLIAFTNNAGPLFIVGFVGTGLFGSARAGYLMLVSHIVAAVGVGLVFRFLWQEESAYAHKGALREAFLQYEKFRKDNETGFGHVLGNSVKNAMESMVLIGGFIILFCVVIKALEIGGLFYLFSNMSQIAGGFTSGLIEVANGAKMIARGGPPNQAALAATVAIISFGGFSVHGQTAHFLRQTDIKFGPYLLAKCLQACTAGAVCWFLAG